MAAHADTKPPPGALGWRLDLSDPAVTQAASDGPEAPVHPHRRREAAVQWLTRHAARLVLAIGILGYLFYEVSAGYFAYTGDAFVSGDTVAVAPTVPGPIKLLPVRNNQVVKAGDLLFQIDPAPFQLAVEEAQAKLKLAEANLVQSRDDVTTATEEVAQRQATLSDAQVTEGRLRTLRSNEFTSQQTLDDAVRDERIASALVLQAKARLTASQQGVLIGEAQAAVSRAALDLARYNLGQTTVRAPQAGRIAPFQARVGDYRGVSEPVLALVTDRDWYVVANLTERHLTHVREGQTVWFTVGSHPWHIRTGRIRSVSNGISRTQGEVKVLPYVETTTDWIRLPRRFPVEIDLGDLPQREPLFLGADARVMVWF